MAHASYTRARLQATLAAVGGLVLWWRLHGIIPAMVAGLLAAFALVAWIAPERHAPVQRLLDWMTRKLVAGFSWLMLGLVYFGLFTPLRLIVKLMGRDPLRLKPEPKAKTYLRPLPPASTGRFGRQF